jgi:hypothetical protein
MSIQKRAVKPKRKPATPILQTKKTTPKPTKKQTASNVTIIDDKQTQKKNISRFLITINTNQVPKTQDDKDKFRKRINKLLLQMDKLIMTRFGHQVDPDPDITVSPYYEQGKLMGRYHCHIDCVVKHNSNIGINATKLNTCIKPFGWYANLRYIKGNDDINRMLKYIRKEQPQVSR